MNIKLRTIIGILAFSLTIFMDKPVSADTPLEDLQMTLSIETQDLITDFEDAQESVEKERVVIYGLDVINSGSKSHKNVVVFLGEPAYMTYQKNSTKFKRGLSGSWVDVVDENESGPLVLGYDIEEILPGETIRFESHYKVTVPDAVLDDPLHTVAFASAVAHYSAIPIFSNNINTTITGEAVGALNVSVESYPPAGQQVFSGAAIDYQYTINNAGGLPVDGVNLVTYLPDGLDCIENCGTILFTEPLLPGESVSVIMRTQVKVGIQTLDEIRNVGFDISSLQMDLETFNNEIIHPLNAQFKPSEGDFVLLTEQVPNLILNSANGQPRSDQADMTETQYAIQYTGRGRPNTFNLTGGYGIYDTGYNLHKGYCSDYLYPHGKNSTVYAYNSSGGGCDEMSNCSLQSSSLQFLLNSSFPSQAPRLVVGGGDHSKSEIYSYGDTSSVNNFMQNGGVLKAPDNFTLARAIEDGALGTVESFAESQGLNEDLWSYTTTGEMIEYDSCSCGEDCTHTDEYPVHTWQKTSSEPIDLTDDDSTNISVYSSTAWLKTEGGHVGTNGAILNNNSPSNWVNLTFEGGDYMLSNEYVHDPDRILTPSSRYTPVGETNGDYMIFANQGNEAFVSAQGESWQVGGTDFSYLRRGEAYDRENNPRDYYQDLLTREKYGPVKVDQLPPFLEGQVDINDAVVWQQNGDLTIGSEGIDDEVIFTGGQSRIHVDGDLYINANIFYDSHSTNHYNDITSLRIDAKNVYISGEVEDIELLILARENFYSGESHQQLRILGDVIAGQAYWQRKPLLELNPDKINQPSEYIIEDMRKYAIPAPGDTELPDEYHIWQQVNPGTGAILDPY